MDLKRADVIYEAERLISLRGLRTILDDPQEYLDGVRQSTWFSNRYKTAAKRKYVVVMSNHQQAWSNLDNNTIYLPPWSRSDLILLHELDHMATRDMDHGTRFFRAYHELIGRFMSKEAADCFKFTVRACGLKFP